MTRRVLIHCNDSADQRALYFLAMRSAVADPDTLVATLRPAEEEPFDLTARLDHLARCYSSVRLEGGTRLHEASGAFIREYLLTTEVRATDEVRDLARRAGEAARAHRKKLEAYLPLLEERCKSEDWTETTLDLAHWLLWQEELLPGTRSYRALSRGWDTSATYAGGCWRYWRTLNRRWARMDGGGSSC